MTRRDPHRSPAVYAVRTFEADYRVRFDEAGPDGSLRTSGYMRYAQDVAWRHSDALSFGREWYAERALTWLVRAAELAILEDVPMGTTLTAQTRVVGMRRVFARRRGEFRLPDGRLAGWVHTDWVMIDGRGALTRIPPIFGDMFGGNSMTGPGRACGAAGGAGRSARPGASGPAPGARPAGPRQQCRLSRLARGGHPRRGPRREGARAIVARPRHYRLEFPMAAAAGAESRHRPGPATAVGASAWWTRPRARTCSGRGWSRAVAADEEER